MRKIINKVQSPFTDEKIQQLIKQYIAWDGEFSGFYRMINGIDHAEMSTNPFLADVNNQLWRKNKISGNSSEFWNIIVSENNYLKIPDNYEERKELYRIYLNLKGQDKAAFVERYVQQCEARNKGYKFKYSTQDGRDDEVVIITDAENLEVDIEIVQQISKGMQLGQLPQLVGTYEHGIGVAEEYIESPIYSYTEVRLDMIPKAITKYIFDNAIEFIEYCDAKQVKLIEDIRKTFARRIMLATHDISKLPEDSNERKREENEKHAYEENINLGEIGYGTHIVVVRELMAPLRQFMEDNYQNALPEMVSNFRMVCQAHEISEQGVFSISTIQKLELSQDSEETREKTLTELQQELEKLMKKEKRTTQQRDEAKLLRNAYMAELNKENAK